MFLLLCSILTLHVQLNYTWSREETALKRTLIARVVLDSDVLHRQCSIGDKNALRVIVNNFASNQSGLNRQTSPSVAVHWFLSRPC